MFLTADEAARKSRIAQYDRWMSRFALLPLDQLRGLPRVVDQIECGVYFLWYGPALVYIGQSQNVAVRVGQHKYFNVQFTHATFQLVSWRCVRNYEGNYIRHYEPPFNIMGTARR
jgi:hypothetical protein